jgi:hypothetical protein
LQSRNYTDAVVEWFFCARGVDDFVRDDSRDRFPDAKNHFSVKNKQ